MKEMKEKETLMSCCSGHGLCHHHGDGHPSGGCHGPAEPDGSGFGRRRRGRVGAEDLAGYLEDLEAEVARVRGELDELRNRDTTEGQ